MGSGVAKNNTKGGGGTTHDRELRVRGGRQGMCACQEAEGLNSGCGESRG